MTRGTLACVIFNFEKQQFEINSSTEFNGDMGVDMSEGKFALNKLKKVKDIEQFKDVVWKTIVKFKYQDEYDNGRQSQLLWNHSCENKGNNIENPYVIDENILSNVFNYSDYEYLINISDKSFFFNDRNGHIVELMPNGKEIAIMSYCYYIGSMIDGKTKFLPAKERNDLN